MSSKSYCPLVIPDEAFWFECAPSNSRLTSQTSTPRFRIEHRYQKHSIDCRPDYRPPRYCSPWLSARPTQWHAQPFLGPVMRTVLNLVKAIGLVREAIGCHIDGKALLPMTIARATWLHGDKQQRCSHQNNAEHHKNPAMSPRSAKIPLTGVRSTPGMNAMPRRHHIYNVDEPLQSNK